jgi:hypothetical protein
VKSGNHPPLRRSRGPGSGRDEAAPAADAFDRRIVALLAFGPVATVVALAAMTGRGTIAMWGYPLWLFLGLWFVIEARNAIETARLRRIVGVWGAMFAVFVIAFVANYAVLPQFDHRYRAVFYPGEALGAEISRRYRALTGRPLAYVIGSMWDGGNIGHYAPERPRVLIDGRPGRAPWIDLADLRSKGAVVVWTDGDPQKLPPGFRAVAEDAEVQPPFVLPYRRGGGGITVGWAVLRPRPAFAQSSPAYSAACAGECS